MAFGPVGLVTLIGRSGVNRQPAKEDWCVAHRQLGYSKLMPRAPCQPAPKHSA